MSFALIVEDEPEANRLLCLLVQMRGYRTASAFNGTEAFRKLGSDRPDVILLDLMLPDTNGYDICREVRNRRDTCQIPVIVVSARLAEENRTRCFQVGAQAFVPKPFTPDQIFHALDLAAGWKLNVERDGHRGTIPLGGDEDHLARSLAQMRSSLLLHTPLNDHRVADVLAAVRHISQGARAWRERSHQEISALASYAIDDQALVLTITDHSEWFASGDFTEAAGGFDPPLDRVFDQIERMPESGSVILRSLFTDLSHQPT